MGDGDGDGDGDGEKNKNRDKSKGKKSRSVSPDRAGGYESDDRGKFDYLRKGNIQPCLRGAPGLDDHRPEGWNDYMRGLELKREYSQDWAGPKMVLLQN